MIAHPSRWLMLSVVSVLVMMPPNTKAVPEPGHYSGIVRITKSTRVNRTNTLSVTTTMKVEAQVFESNSEMQLTILGAASESLVSAFNTRNCIIQATFQSDGGCIVHGPPFGGPGGPGDYPAFVTERPKGFTLSHENLPLGMAWLVDPHLTEPITRFEYRFQKVEPGPGDRARRSEGRGRQ